MSHSHVGHYADAPEKSMATLPLHIFTLTAQFVISTCIETGQVAHSSGAHMKIVYQIFIANAKNDLLKQQPNASL